MECADWVPVAEGMDAEDAVTSQQSFVREEFAWWNMPRADDRALVEVTSAVSKGCAVDGIVGDVSPIETK